MKRLRKVPLAVLASLTFSASMAVPAAASSPTTPTTTWTRLSPASSPSPRNSAATAYDSAIGEIVLFGGSNGGSELNDTWTFNGTTWTQLSPATSPPARAYGAMAYDPATGDIVVFGGSGNSGDLNDTWIFDGKTSARVSPASSPPARDSASMAYDPALGKIVLFGGEGNSGNLGDTWTFNGTTWKQLSPTTSPSARWYASMVYDPVTQYMVLFGGSGNNEDLSDTWTFDGTNWTHLALATNPPPRDSASIAYDPKTGSLVLFGGEGNSGDMNDTWSFNGDDWTQISASTSPPARDGASMAYDLATGNMILYGGSGHSVNLSDTWTLVQNTVALTQGNPISAVVAFGAGYSGHSLALTNPTGTVSYTETKSADSADVAVSGTGTISVATSLAPGTYVVGGDDSDTNGDTGSWIFSLTVVAAAQTITFTSAAPSNATAGDTYVVAATGGPSGNAVTFSTTSMCTVSGSEVTFIGVGECIIDANQAGDADYLPATEATQTITVGKAFQTIAFTSKPPSEATVGDSYIVSAAGGPSDNAVIFSTTSRCSVSGSKVRFIGVGECIIDANQAGDADYLPAAQAQQTITVRQGAQVITFTSRVPTDATMGASYTVRAVGGPSGHSVIFHARSMCVVAGSKVRFIGAGECVVEANQAGDRDYLPATQVTQTFRVDKASTRITLRLSTSEASYGHEQAQRLSVTVWPQFLGTPTGRVTISAAGITLCAMTLSSGKRTCMLSPRRLKEGTFRLVAVYHGARNFKGSTSTKKTFVVSRWRGPSPL